MSKKRNPRGKAKYMKADTLKNTRKKLKDDMRHGDYETFKKARVHHQYIKHI